ncbi:MAG: hypothetical protein AAGA57_01505 [Planctomycetota bacterium]
MRCTRWLSAVAASAVCLWVPVAQGQDGAREAAEQEVFEALVQAQADAAAAGEALEAAQEELAGADDVADPEAEPAAEGPTDEELIAKFTVRPSAVSLNLSVNFDEQGNVRHRNQSGSVSVSARFDPKEVRVVSYGQLRIRRVVTRDGRSIEMGEDAHRHHGRSRVHGNTTQIGVSGQIPAEALGALGIERLEADFEVRVGLGEPEMAVLDPLQRFYGKRVAIADLPGSWFQVDKNANGLRLTANKTTFERFAEPEIYDERGRKLQSRGWSSGSNGQTQYREFRLQAPEDGRMILWLDREVRDVTIPVVIEDIPAPGGAAPARPDLVIRLGPPAEVLRDRLPLEVEGGAPRRGLPPVPDGPQVELRIEGEEIEERGDVREGLRPGLGGAVLAGGEARFAEVEPLGMDAPRVIGDLHLRGAPVIPFEDVQLHEPLRVVTPLEPFEVITTEVLHEAG